MKKLTGVPASAGKAIGKAYVYESEILPEIKRYTILKDQLEAELKRLEAAYDKAEKELQSIHKKALGEAAGQADIFAAHIMMIQDPEIMDQVKTEIKQTLENAEFVVRKIYGKLAQTMEASGDPMFSERVADINEISGHLLRQLLHVQKKTLKIPDTDVIAAADDLSPSEILAMNKNHVKGLVLRTGGRTSHIAILARTFNIPAVMGLASSFDEIMDGSELAIDGDSGAVYIDPGKDELEKFRNSVFHNSSAEISVKSAGLPAETKDGRGVLLKANIEFPEEAGAACGYGAMGIGLYRSEFLFLGSGKAADEEQQYAAYSSVLKTMGKLPVTIRTVDIGGDKLLPEFDSGDEKNPLLGWRAIRFSLSRPQIFKIQLRALLRAGVNGNARIMFPLITGIEELEKALALLEEAKSECKKLRQPIAEKIETGIMIEVPSAAITADLLAEKSDFFSIGTNDLIQYTLAVDRGNEKVDYLAQPLHPAILRSIKMTIEAAGKKGIKTSMCGEMAGDPKLTAVLIGLGLDELSMTAPSIPLVKKIMRELTSAECEDLAGELLAGKSAAANSALLQTWTNKRLKSVPELAQ
ncbi:MAG: phosphoenolpyruvate--protein phosphotransferase [Treponema sp.]|nr:phosphoenolpyruvate--protein phosphotransferase [Treponema sp.]